MPIIYHLSKRQLKELDRRAILDICVPHPERELRGRNALGNWLIEHVDLPDGCTISDVDRISVAVDPLARHTGLQRLFGALVDDPKPGDPERITCNIDVIAFRVCKVMRPRASHPINWPGSVTLPDGRTLPERA